MRDAVGSPDRKRTRWAIPSNSMHPANALATPGRVRQPMSIARNERRSYPTTRFTRPRRTAADADHQEAHPRVGDGPARRRHPPTPSIDRTISPGPRDLFQGPTGVRTPSRTRSSRRRGEPQKTRGATPWHRGWQAPFGRGRARSHTSGIARILRPAARASHGQRRPRVEGGGRHRQSHTAGDVSAAEAPACVVCFDSRISCPRGYPAGRPRPDPSSGSFRLRVAPVKPWRDRV
jgi:hypothetical protein